MDKIVNMFTIVKGNLAYFHIIFGNIKAMLYNVAVAYGEKLRQIRKDKGLTQSQLEEKTGINRASISYYEANKVEIPAKNLIAIARALGVSIYDITGDPMPLRTAAEIAEMMNIDQLIAALEKHGFSGKAIEFARLLHERGSKIEDWQLAAIHAILRGKEPK